MYDFMHKYEVNVVESSRWVLICVTYVFTFAFTYVVCFDETNLRKSSLVY